MVRERMKRLEALERLTLAPRQPCYTAGVHDADDDTYWLDGRQVDALTWHTATVITRIVVHDDDLAA